MRPSISKPGNFTGCGSERVKKIKSNKHHSGGGDSSVVRAPDWVVIERSRVRIPAAGNGGRIFFSRVDFLCWLLFRYPFHPRVTTVARKKSRSFCQKCRWQVQLNTHTPYVCGFYWTVLRPIGHNLSLICQMTSEDIKHQLIIIISPIVQELCESRLDVLGCPS